VKLEVILNRLMDLGLSEGRALWLRVDEKRCTPYRSVPDWDDSMLARITMDDEMNMRLTDCIERNSPYEGPMALEILGHRETYIGECLPLGQDHALAILSPTTSVR
jgi:hypothetical protein